MPNMSFLNAAIILAVVCSSAKVYSKDPLVSSMYYDFGNRELIVGNDHVDKTSLVYAICEDNHQSITECAVKFHPDVFDESKHRWTCDYTIITKYANGIIDVLEIHPWSQDKAVFIWQDRENNDTKTAEVTIRTVYLRSCEVMDYKLNVDLREDMKSQLFVMIYEDSYDVAFLDNERCGDHFCKITVCGRHQCGEDVHWFPNFGLVYALEPTNHRSNKLLVYVDESNEDSKTKLYLMDELSRTRLGKYNNITNVGWSSSNGIISFCTYGFCVHCDHSGKSKTSKILRLSHSPTQYAALYNLPDQKHLAVVCDMNPADDHYRIIKIESEGYEEYSYTLEEFECSRKPKIMTSKFFNGNNGEYCLSIFYSLNSRADSAKFNTYCFSA